MAIKEQMQPEISNKGSRDYLMEGERVRLMWKKFVPQYGDQQPTYNPNSAIIFFCGFSGNEQGETIGRVSQSLANCSGIPTYAINTRVGNTDDILLKEAKAVQRFVEDEELTEITLSGHSLGGVKAINLAYLLQSKNPEIKVNGIILFNSVGLYDTEPSSLGFACFKDSLLTTPIAVARKMDGALLKQCLRANIDVVLGIAGEIGDLKLDYLKRSRQVLKEAAMVNPRLSRIEAPVVLLQGIDDQISDPKGFVDIEDVFPNSRTATRIVGQKIGLHGLPLFRTGSAVKVGLYELSRAKRKTDCSFTVSELVAV